MAYLPPDHARVGNKLAVEYMAEQYPVTVAAVGSKPLAEARRAGQAMTREQATAYALSDR